LYRSPDTPKTPTTSPDVLTSVGKGWGRGIENFDFFYLIYWRKQGRGIENWDFSIPFSYTGFNFLVLVNFLIFSEIFVNHFFLKKSKWKFYIFWHKVIRPNSESLNHCEVTRKMMGIIYIISPYKYIQ